MPVSFLIEYGASIGLDVLKDRIPNISEHHAIKKILMSYIERKATLNEQIPLDEEIDFEGFCDYILKNLLADIKTYVYARGGDRIEIKTAIIRKAQLYSDAKSPKSRARVECYVSELIRILYEFYRSYKTDEGMLLVAGEIEQLMVEQFGDLRQTMEDLRHKMQSNNEINKATRDSVRKIEDYIYNVDPLLEEKQRIKKYIDNYINKSKKRTLNQAVFPWLRDSIRYKEAFPRLFIQPTFNSHGTDLTMDEISTGVPVHTVFLGEAGVGKTTFLQYVFAFLLADNNNLLLITAKEARQKEGILDKIQQYISISPNEHFHILIDGLDEEFMDDYLSYKDFIFRLSTAINMTFWLTCRTDFYSRYYNESFAFVEEHFVINPWDRTQANRFIKSYAEITRNDRILIQFHKMVQSSDVILQFLRNPFELSLLLFLLDQNDSMPIRGIYNLYERFLYRWIVREQKRGTSPDSKERIMQELVEAATKIYDNEIYIQSAVSDNNTAVRNLLSLRETDDIYHTLYAEAFYHRSLAAFLLAHSFVEALLSNDEARILLILGSKMKDDVTSFICDKFVTLNKEDRLQIRDTLIDAFFDTHEDEVCVKEQNIYFITRLGIDVSDFLLKLVRDNPKHPIMRMTIAYGCALSDTPEIRNFALVYAKSISEDTIDAITNRGWAMCYFGDVTDRDPYEYTDDEKRSWRKAQAARLKHFTKSTPKLSDYRFRLFDIPLFHSFHKDRNWMDATIEEYQIFLNADFPESIYTPEEIAFIQEEKEKFLAEYESHLQP